MIVIWDFSEDKVVLVRGHTDLNLKNKFNDFPKEELSHDTLSVNEQEEKEITALCWASFDGLILAVGYVDGDIMFWNLNNADKPSNEVVKLQLSSANRRLPVIVLNWLESKSHNNYRGQLFVYGGDEIGSEEVLTVSCFTHRLSFLTHRLSFHMEIYDLSFVHSSSCQVVRLQYELHVICP